IVAAGDAALDAHDVEAARRHLDAAPADHRGWEWQHVQSRFDRSLRTTDVGPGRVSDVAYHPAGDVFAAAAPNAVRIFDDSSGAELFRLETHGAPEALAWSPAGDRLAVRATRGVEIWSWPDRRRRVLIDATQRGEVFAWSGDGRRLAIGGDSGIVRVIAAESGRPVSSLQTRSRILSLDVHPTLPLVACGHWDGHASLWDLETGDARWTRRVGPQGLHDIAFLGDRFLVTPSELPHVHVWNVQDGSLHRTTSSRLGPGVNGVGIARDGRRLVLGSVIHLASYDATTFEPLVAWQDPLPFYALSVHPSGTRAATAGRGGRIQEWGLDPDADPTMLTGHIDDVWDVAYAPSGAFLVSGGIGVLRVWDARTGEQRRAWIGNRWTIMRVAVSPDSRTVAAGDRNGDVVLWDVATDTIRARLGGHGDFLRQIVFAPDGARLYVAAGSGEIHVWDLARHARIATQKVQGGGGALAVHPSGRLLAVGTADGRLELRDAETLERVWSAEAHEQMITRLVFDPRADRLITASEDGHLKVWRRKDGTLVRSREGGGILALAISPDGRRVATGGRDGAIRLWDPDTGQLVFTRGRLATWIPGLAFSPDGTQLAAAETTGRVRILDTVPIRERLRGHRETLARRERARQIVDGVHRTEKDTTRVIAMLRERDDLDPAMREAALREAYRRHGSADGLADYLWRAVARRRLGPIDRGIAWGLAADMVRAHGHRNVQDRRRTTLFGAVRARIGDHQGALATLKTASTFNEGREPGLFAVDLAFLTICHARLTQRADAVATLARLETHLERHPTLLDDRIVRFRDEAREAVARMKQR
nr:hypothetical protein [Planctomycetota bacterium]